MFYQYVSIQCFVKVRVAQYIEPLSHAAVSITKMGKRLHSKIAVVFSYNARVTIAAKEIHVKAHLLFP